MRQTFFFYYRLTKKFKNKATQLFHVYESRLQFQSFHGFELLGITFSHKNTSLIKHPHLYNQQTGATYLLKHQSVCPVFSPHLLVEVVLLRIVLVMAVVMMKVLVVVLASLPL